MKTIFNLILLAAVFYVIGWFVRFENDPRQVCIDHPKDSGYWLCEPGEFELKKGELERSSPMPWRKTLPVHEKRQSAEKKEDPKKLRQITPEELSEYTKTLPSE